MKNTIINGMLGLFLCGLFVVALKTYNINDTIDAFSGATPTNAVVDAMSGATTSDDEDDDDDEDEWDDD